MALTSVAQYRATVLDTTSSDNAITGALAEAQELAEQFTHREFTEAERTETLRVGQDGRVYPTASPITSVSDPAGAEILDASIVTGWAGLLWLDRTLVGWRDQPPRADTTYVGGWTAATFPVGLRRLVCQIAYDLLHPAADFAQIPAGVSSARVGDVAVSTGGLSFQGGSGSFDPFAAIKPAVATQLRAWRKPDVLG